MKIVNIIDSLELNGGSTMFLEMTAGMQKYWPEDEIKAYVVSKTGKFGREGLVNSDFAPSYGVDLDVYDYTTFEKNILPTIKKSIVFHHVLGYTKNMVFHKSCKYVVINHTATNVKRLPGFKPYKLICVSGYFAKRWTRIRATLPAPGEASQRSWDTAPHRTSDRPRWPPGPWSRTPSTPTCTPGAQAAGWRSAGALRPVLPQPSSSLSLSFRQASACRRRLWCRLSQQ